MCAHQATGPTCGITTMTIWMRIQIPSAKAGRDPQRDDLERQHPDAHARMQHQVGGDDAGNRAAGADQRACRLSGTIQA